jgi:hypothetical protein
VGDVTAPKMTLFDEVRHIDAVNQIVKRRCEPALPFVGRFCGHPSEECFRRPADPLVTDRQLNDGAPQRGNPYNGMTGRRSVTNKEEELPAGCTLVGGRPCVAEIPPHIEKIQSREVTSLPCDGGLYVGINGTAQELRADILRRSGGSEVFRQLCAVPH